MARNEPLYNRPLIQPTSFSIAPRPKQYTEDLQVEPWNTDPSFPSTTVKADDINHLTIDLSDKDRWLKHVKDVLDNNGQDQIQQIFISWAAFHASRTAAVTNVPLDISCLLPPFQEEAKSVAMILHAMNTVKSSVEFLNPGQTPLITCDHPLYAIAKKIQWQLPETQGEKNFVVVLEGLHIEMTAWRTMGDFLDGSGWTSAIMKANVASSGTADSFLKASHVSRTRDAHQVTACSLHILMSRAYGKYVEGLSESDTKLEFHQWQDYKSFSCPQFEYWSMVLKIELMILLFVRSLWEGQEEEATSAFTDLCRMPSMQDVLNAMPVLERFVVLLYDRKSPCQGVNDARKVLFAQKGREHPPLLIHYYNTRREWPTKLVIARDSGWYLILSYLLQVNGGGHYPRQMHGSLSGPHYLKHQKYARSW